MEKNESLEKLCLALHERPPNWPGIIERYKLNQKSKLSKSRFEHEYAKHFSEIHLDLSLEELARENPEFNISLNPGLKNGDKSENFRFEYDDSSQLFVYDKEGVPVREYDKLIEVDGLPTVFEIKIARWHAGKTRRKKGRSGRVPREDTVQSQMLPLIYNKKLAPVREFYDEDIGFVLVMPNNVYHQRASGNKFFRLFESQNGIAVPFYTGRKSFRSDVIEKAWYEELELKN